MSVFLRASRCLAGRIEKPSSGSQKCYQETNIFAGQRRFLVSTIERFWYWYKEQHGVAFYELIQQDRPARLYFDLEFYRETNPNADEKLLIKDFNDCVGEVLLDMFGVVLNPDQVYILVQISFGFSVLCYIVNASEYIISFILLIVDTP